MKKLLLPLLAAVTCATLIPAAAVAAPTKSISSYVSCNGSTDDSEGVAKAFDAAKNNAFTLVVDCPVHLHIGVDIARPVFIDTGTTVEFTGRGKFTIDNVWQPAFVIANSDNITLNGWNVEYDGGMPVNQQTGTYTQNGQVIKTSHVINAAYAFNDVSISNWLTAHRGVIFNQSQGNVRSIWAGPTNQAAMFYIIGSSSNIKVNGMDLYVPAGVGGDHFIPTAFAFDATYKSNQTVTAKTTVTSAHVAIPTNLDFSNVTIDGVYMGFVGDLQDANFDNIVSKRYGDLQDANGGTVGGVNKWFAPPHLFYFKPIVRNDDGPLLNDNIQIRNVDDQGPRIGVARDKGGSDSVSGYALSLKLGCNNCIVDTYRSARPDGFLDVLSSQNLVISNASATFNSNFVHSVYAAWRFPDTTYKNLTFENITLTDTAASSTRAPVGSSTLNANENITLTNVKVNLNHWNGALAQSLPTYYGTGNSASVDFSYSTDTTRLAAQQKSPVMVTLHAKPATFRAGGSTVLTWTTHDASSCSATGSWSGGRAPNGTLVVELPRAGTYDYQLTCRNSSNVTVAILPIIVTQ